MRPAVEIRGLGVRYPGGAQVLAGCDLQLHYGQLAVLSGPSGGGKSTLLCAINGIIPQAIHARIEGEILVDGRPTEGLKMADIARHIGSVLQNPDSQIFHSRVADEIAFGCENLNLPPGEIHGRVEACCALLGLDPGAPTKTLSGGQKQRLMVACALAMGQKTLLLDEPLANLDLAGARLLLDVLRGLCRKGYAVLLAEHRLDIVAPYADRHLALEQGCIAERPLGGHSTQPVADSPLSTHPGGTLLSLEDVHYSVRGLDILRHVGLDIGCGVRYVLLGENGSGKTTLLRLLAGLIKPTRGTLQRGFPARPGSRGWFRYVGYVYQEPSYQLFMPTVRQEVCYGAHGDWGGRCLAEFGLEALADRHPHALSEGQKRRVSIAAVMATAPRLLLLDEPTVGQDDANLGRMVDTLNRFHSETGNSMLTITHDLRCARALADRVIWLEKGVLRQGGRELIDGYFTAQGMR